MPILATGNSFAAGDQATHTRLNAAVNAATFDTTGAVDNASTQISGGAIIVKDGGIGSAKLASDSTNANASRVKLNRGTYALTDAATIATDCSLSNVFTVTLGGNRTLGAPTNILAGATYIWIITQDGTGSRTLAYNSVFKWQGGVSPTLTTTAAAKDMISAVSPDGTNLYCTSILNLS